MRLFLTHVLLALYFGDTEVQGQNFRDLFLKLFHVCFMHFQSLQTFSMATVCRMFKVSFTEVLPMFVSCIWNTQGTGGQTEWHHPDCHLLPLHFFLFAFVSHSFVLFFVSHVQFCKAKSRSNLSQVFSLQRSLTVSSALTYNTPLLSSPLLSSPLLSSPLLSSPLLSSPLLSSPLLSSPLLSSPLLSSPLLSSPLLSSLISIPTSP